MDEAMNPFVILLIVLNVASAGWYGVKGDWTRVVYWLSAAALNICVLKMK